MQRSTRTNVFRHTLFILFGALSLYVALIATVDQQVSVAQGTIRYAKTNGVTTGTCSSWGTACTIARAMSVAVAGDEIWVAAGVYTPTVGIAQTAAFTLTNGVAMYGGFAGTETLRAQRNFTTNVTALSGDVGTVGVHGDNVYHVIVATDVSSTTVLDGFTVRDGRGSGYTSSGNGAGMFLNNVSMVIANVVFTNNVAGPNGYGGAIYNKNGRLTLNNVQFTQNAASYGAGVYNNASSITLQNALFRSNAATMSGGGLYNSSSDPVLVDVTFQSNDADYAGGAIYSNLGMPRLTSVQFISNTSALYGGALYNFKSTFSITNAEFSGNSAKFNGGAVYLSRGSFEGSGLSFYANSAKYNGGAVFADTSYMTVTQLTAAHNSAQYGGGFYNDTATALITNSTFYSNVASVDGGALFNDAAPVVLVHMSAVENEAKHYGGAIYSILNAPTVRNSLLWGNKAVKGATNIGTASYIDALVEGGCPIGVSCVRVISTDPKLGSFSDHGGPLETISLQTGSSAIDKVTASCPATDERGVARPRGSACDLGAYETRGFTLSVVSGNNQSVEVYEPYAQPLVVSATSIEGHIVDGAPVTFSSPVSGPATNPVSQTTTFAGGQASINVTAGSFAGTYSVTVSAPGSQPIYFNMNNLDTPVAGLQAWQSSPAKVGQPVYFTATVEGGTNIVFDWEFGDGSTATGSQLAHTYTVNGSYVVTVTAHNELYAAHETLDVEIVDVELAGLTAQSNGPTALGQATQFLASTEAGTGVAYTWDFDDGATGVGPSPAHTYAAAGTYTATVTATNTRGSANAKTRVLVERVLENVELLPAGTAYGEVGRAVSFSIEVAAGVPTTVTWLFGDEQIQAAGATAAEAGAVPWTTIEHVYAAPGAYQVLARVANSVSQFDVSAAVHIDDVPITIPTITWSGQQEINEPISFSAQSAQGTSVTCMWEFGDGTPPIAGCDMQHTFVEEGNFEVELWMVNSKGVAFTESSITIIDPTPGPIIDEFSFLPFTINSLMQMP